MPSRTRVAVSSTWRVASRYPASPMVTIAAHASAESAPGRLPANVGEKYSPPGQSVVA